MGVIPVLLIQVHVPEYPTIVGVVFHFGRAWHHLLTHPQKLLPENLP